MAEEVANPKIVITAEARDAIRTFLDTGKASADLGRAVESLGKSFDVQAVQSKKSEQSIKRVMDSISGAGATAKMNELAQAVERLGGAEKLTASQTENLARRIESLKSQGAAVNASLANISAGAASSAGKIESAFAAVGTQQVQNLTGSLGPLGAVLTTLGTTGMVAGVGLAATVGAVAGLSKLAMNAATWGDNVKDTSIALGMTTDSVQRLQHAAAVAEVPFETVTGSVLKMQKALINSPEIFEALGLSIEEMGKKAPEQQLVAVAEKLKLIEDPALRNTTAIKILGKSWEELAPLIMDGLGAMDKAQVMSKETVDQLDSLKQATNTLTAAWDKMWIALGAAVARAPIVASSMKLVVDVMETTASFLGQAGLNGGGAPKQKIPSKRINLKSGNQMDLSTGEIFDPAQEARDKKAAADADQKLRNLENDKKAAAQAEAAAKAAADKHKKLVSEFTGAATQARMDELTGIFKEHQGAIEGNSTAYAKFVAEVKKLATEGAKLPAIFEDMIDLPESMNLMSEKFIGPLRPQDLATRFGVGPGQRELSVAAAPEGLLGAFDQAGGRRFGGAIAELNTVIDEGKGFWSSYGDVVETEIDTANDGLKKAKTATVDWSKVLQDVTNTMQVLGISSNSTFARVVGGFAAGSAAGDSFMKATTTSGELMAMAQGVGGIISSAKGKSNGAGALAGATQFGAFGMQAAGPIGAGIGAGVGAIIGGLTASLTRHATAFNHVGRQWGIQISEGLGKQIDEDAQKLFKGDIETAALSNLKGIFDESGGVGGFGRGAAAGKVRDLFSALETGKMTLAQTGEAFDSVFGEVAGAHISKTSGIASAQLLELVDLAKRFKIESPALSEFLKGQATGGAEGFSSGLSGLKTSREKGGQGLVSQTAASGISAGVFGEFQAMRDSGMGVREAISAIAPAVTAMREELTAAGFDGSAAFAGLESQISIVTGEITGPLLASTSGFTAGMVSLFNTGGLTAEMFAGLTAQVGANVLALQAQGVEGPAAMQALQPDLQKIWELTQKTGFAVDATTQGLIDQAVQAGAVGEEHRSAADKIVDATERMAAALEYMAQRAGYAGGELDKAMKDRSATLTLNEVHTGGGGFTTPSGTTIPTERPDPLVLNAEGGMFRYRPGGTAGVFGEKEDEFAVPASKAVAFAEHVLEQARGLTVPSAAGSLMGGAGASATGGRAGSGVSLQVTFAPQIKAAGSPDEMLSMLTEAWERGLLPQFTTAAKTALGIS